MKGCSGNLFLFEWVLVVCVHRGIVLYRHKVAQNIPFYPFNTRRLAGDATTLISDIEHLCPFLPPHQSAQKCRNFFISNNNLWFYWFCLLFLCLWFHWSLLRSSSPIFLLICIWLFSFLTMKAKVISLGSSFFCRVVIQCYKFSPKHCN